MVAGVIATLKAAVSAWFKGTFTAPFTGTVAITVGRAGAGSVKKVHTYLLASGVPARSVAPVVIVAVYRVLNARLAPGVKVATAPAQPIVPGTWVTPGPVTVNAATGNAAQFIASLKVALRTWPTGTSVAVFTGTVAITAGAGVIVVNVQTLLTASGVPARSVAPVVIVAV
jgi:hypothetical protein